MRRRNLALALALSTVAADASAGDEPRPLPVEKTAILRSGGSYTVEGRVRIPKGVELTVQKETKIVGKGEDAVIEVVGELILRGVSDGRVRVEGVTIEPQEDFAELRTDMVDFVAGSKGVRTAGEKPALGRISVQNTTFEYGSALDVTLGGGEIEMHRVRAYEKVRIRAAARDPKVAPKVKLAIMNCNSEGGTIGSLTAGLEVQGVDDVTVRTCKLGGPKVSFADCGTVMFDGNLVKARSLEFLQSAPGRFGRTTVTKCDLACDSIVLSAPAAAGRAEKVTFDKCWFGGDTKPADVRRKRIRDSEDDPACNVTVNLVKIMESPHRFAGDPAE